MKQKVFFLCNFICFTVFSQQKFSKEVSFLNDNDLYISTSQDRYYTNGMFFSYRYLKNTSSKKIAKKIFEFQLGHQMYTPFKATVKTPEEHDRPFAGYLFGSFGITNSYNNNAILKTAIQIGSIGPSTKSKELQDFIHEIYGYRKGDGWKYQITNAFALNINNSYIKSLASDAVFDINWITKAELGTVFTNTATGFYTRIGLKPLSKINNSIAFNTNLNNKNSAFNNTSEAFFYIKPMLHYVLYDATIQGSFLNSSSPITFEVEPFVFTTEIGIRATFNQFHIGYTVNYHTKKLKSLRVPEGNFYGTIQINYLFN